MILLFNLNTLYVMILSGQSTIAINVMIALAAFQFICIVIYHIFNYVLTGSLKNRIQLCINIKEFSQVNTFNHRDMFYCNRIPNITYNYSEYHKNHL